jgi:hypothetical protein
MTRPLASGESETAKTYVKVAEGFASDADFLFKVAQRVIIVAGIQYATTRAVPGSTVENTLTFIGAALRLLLTLWLSTSATAKVYPVIRWGLERVHVERKWQRLAAFGLLAIICALGFWHIDGFVVRTIHTLIDGIANKPK